MQPDPRTRPPQARTTSTATGLDMADQEQEALKARSLKRSSTMPELSAGPSLTVQPPTPLDIHFAKADSEAWRNQMPSDNQHLFASSYHSNASSSAFRSGEESAYEDEASFQNSPAPSCELMASPLSSHVHLRSSASPTPSSVVSPPTSRRGSKAKAKAALEDPNQPKRPLNSFMLYRKDKWPAVPNKNHQSISRIIGEMWRNESRETKERYDHLAKEAKAQHQALYPGYKFHPKKRKEKDGKAPVKSGVKYRTSGLVSDSGIQPSPYSHGDYMCHVHPPYPYGYYSLQPERGQYPPASTYTPASLFPTASEARASLGVHSSLRLPSQQGAAFSSTSTPPHSTPAQSSSDESPWAVPTAEAALRQHHKTVQLRKQQQQQQQQQQQMQMQDEARAHADFEAQHYARAQAQMREYAWLQAQQAQEHADRLQQAAMQMPPPDAFYDAADTGPAFYMESAIDPQLEFEHVDYGIPEFVDEQGQTHTMAGLLDLSVYDATFDGAAAFGPAQGRWAVNDLHDPMSGDMYNQGPGPLDD